MKSNRHDRFFLQHNQLYEKTRSTETGECQHQTGPRGFLFPIPCSLFPRPLNSIHPQLPEPPCIPSSKNASSSRPATCSDRCASPATNRSAIVTACWPHL